MNIFATLPSGDSATWLDDPVTLPDGRTADASDWVMTYYLRGPVALDIVASAAGKNWSTTLTATASAALGAGTYAWTAIIVNGSKSVHLILLRLRCPKRPAHVTGDLPLWPALVLLP